MVAFGIGVAATMARTRVPDLIAEAFAHAMPTERDRRTPRSGVGLVSGPELTVGRDVMREMVRLAAFEVPGVLRVGRGGPAWRSAARLDPSSARPPATASGSTSRSSPGPATRSSR